MQVRKMLEKCPFQLPSGGTGSWGLWMALRDRWADRRQGRLGQVGTAHSTWLLRVIMGLWTSRERSEPNENSAGRCERPCYRGQRLMGGRPEEQKQNTSKL